MAQAARHLAPTTPEKKHAFSYRRMNMCFIEYNWTAGVWSFRIGDCWTDYRGVRSLPSLNEWRDLVASQGLCLTKTDSRTYLLAPSKKHAFYR
jgi:hypothetical protein